LSAVWLVGLCLCSGCDPWPESTRVFLSSTSPDGKAQLDIVEITGRLRGRFFFRLREPQAGTAYNFFYAGDEGRPGPARIIWARDNSRVLVVGRRFLVPREAELPNGERLYVLYDFRTRKLRCNGTKQSGYETFRSADLEGVEWTESIEFRGTAPDGPPAHPPP